MKRNTRMLLLTFLLWGTLGPARAQQLSEARVPLAEQPVALDAKGTPALAGRLRAAAALAGTIETPTRNARLVIENRSQFFYAYVSGWATFYDSDGVRCGDGVFKLDALAPGESAETDLPGLRVTCTPTTWRIAANNLLTRTTDVAKPPDQQAPPTPSAPASASPPPARTTPSASSASPVPPLVININGEVLPVQLGNPIEIKVNGERLRLIVSAVE